MLRGYQLGIHEAGLRGSCRAPFNSKVDALSSYLVFGVFQKVVRGRVIIATAAATGASHRGEQAPEKR
jgi:hypothetical protein